MKYSAHFQAVEVVVLHSIPKVPIPVPAVTELWNHSHLLFCSMSYKLVDCCFQTKRNKSCRRQVFDVSVVDKIVFLKKDEKMKVDSRVSVLTCSCHDDSREPSVLDGIFRGGAVSSFRKRGRHY